MSRRIRIGLIVPSSNTTMETELPELFRRREHRAAPGFSFHSARMRMTAVTPDALAAMDRHSDRCAVELADADCDVMAYACLVAVMAAGPGAHLRVERRLSETAGPGTPVITSAGALAAGIRSLGVRRVAIIAPYPPPLTRKVVAYLADLGIEVVDEVSLGIADNRSVGRLDPADLIEHLGRLDVRRAQAVVLSACVQMPSLPAIPQAERLTGLPVLSAATATARRLLDTLGLPPGIDGGGALLRSE
ncbi:MAG: maleate cis-trans isomerase family protein [Pseudonocardiaceae bacterium]